MLPVERALLGHAPWEAELALTFAADAAAPDGAERATRLTGCRHRGPLRVQKALYPEGHAVCQAIVLHPPSGIAGGDQLRLEARVGAHAHAQLTTPGAGKWYRSAGPGASQHMEFTVAADGILEWLPQETIVFDGARATMSSRVRLAAGSRYIGWDILCLGRRASGERYTQGQLALHTRLERDGRPLWLERARIAGDDPLWHSAAGWAGHSVGGSLLATTPDSGVDESLLAACRALTPADAALHGVSALPGLLVARYLGDNSEAARLWFAALWHLLRPALLGRSAVPPRLWNT